MSRKAKGPRLVPLKRKGYTNTVYVIRYWDGNHTRDYSTGESEYGEAERKFKKWLATKDSPPGGPGGSTEARIADVLQAYGEERGPQTADPKRIFQIVSNLVEFWGDRPCSAITEETCGEYLENRLASGRAIGTVRRELVGLSAALHWAERKSRLHNPPHVWLPPAPPPKDRWLTREEFTRLLWASRKVKQSREYLPLAIQLACYTGARRGAILGLRWPQVDLVNGVIDFRDGRATNKRRAVIPIPDRLMRALRRAQSGADCEFVISKGGKGLQKLRRSFASACREAGLSDVTFHTLRHTAATWMFLHGVDGYEVAKYLGHTSSRTTERYGHHSPDYLKHAKEAFE